MTNESETRDDVTVTVCPDGPLLVRGPVTVLDGDGRAIANQRNTIALCRCGRTRRPPFCDSSHKRKKRPSDEGD
ncbi:CDGSH iron-sulfur domain-containing protein [Rhodococcus sp. ABRD24]|uniref:CDGSH iron-sulfur domain-containing protein n=1 Tax=Rhodococcus sp. ABRD24 TaxID=2507582 RepID=UPI00103EFFD1|nr:CDGSH iron-sulfur domain-containing protein [Rhodococcus sp. ABRD24]QBJ95958.1 CDGSH iron-sulfur domain-containing protein [Rhodococcus sp. ABRD24]